MSDIAEAEGLTLQQAFVLHALHEGDVMQMGALAARMHCDASNITGIIDRLLTQGYVTRQESVHDRRVKELALTPKGRRFVQVMLDAAPSAVGCSNLRAAERDQFCGLLKRLG